MRISDWSSDVCSSDLSSRAGVWIRPGTIPLQRIPCLPKVVAMVLIYQFTMALEAPYENWPTSPAKALVDEVNRIAPIPRESMCGRAYLHDHTPDRKSTRLNYSH